MIGGNGGVNLLFGTVDALFGTVDREGVGNEEGANLLLLPPLWSASQQFISLGFRILSLKLVQ